MSENWPDVKHSGCPASPLQLLSLLLLLAASAAAAPERRKRDRRQAAGDVDGKVVGSGEVYGRSKNEKEKNK